MTEPEGTVFDGILPVLFGQAYIASDADDAQFERTAYFLGQRNGLLGAAREGLLYLVTGTTDGEVRLTVYVVDTEPLLTRSWEECVEASFAPATPTVSLFDWDRNAICEIPLGGRAYRVRYAGHAMDAGHAGQHVDAYGLWFWPASLAPDTVIRQTSESASYWHSETARINEIRLPSE